MKKLVLYTVILSIFMYFFLVGGNLFGTHQDIFSIIEHACTHMQGGPYEHIRAQGEGMGPGANNPHTRYEIELIAVEEDNKWGGNVHFSASGHNDYLITLDSEIPLTLKQNGAIVEPNVVFSSEEITSKSNCPLIKKAYLFTLEIGKTLLDFGPGTLSSVQMIIEKAHGDQPHNH
ncbi:hypothetical protein QA601_15755 [Chitinispirillales bacterium ANBcel5]|uniref:hypothetical protein n=1 Tax=Cellulosispirillum alkaliphilum TaxID=3039283 RepID=UPI002A4EEF1B|nr:hypothetical protein [Chitinispirillales bacterium ANBcel5]